VHGSRKSAHCIDVSFMECALEDDGGVRGWGKEGLGEARGTCDGEKPNGPSQTAF